MRSRWTDTAPLLAALVLAASAAAAVRAEGVAPAPFDDVTLRRVLQLSPVPPPPPDRSNAVADDPVAAQLGQRLFFDARLSPARVACASCHDPRRAFSDARPLARGAGDGLRRTPSLWNVAYNRWYFWDGRADSLWSQALVPMEGTAEMAGRREDAVALVASDPELAPLYRALFGAPPAAAAGAPGADAASVERAFTNLGKAIAAYERRLVSRRAPFDRFVEQLRAGGPASAIDAAAQRGLALFVGRANCRTCHAGPLFTDGEFHDTGVPARDARGRADGGRWEGIAALSSSRYSRRGPYSDAAPDDPGSLVHFLKREPHDWGTFKTPSLRNVARRAPYMHQGQFATLRDVVTFYSTLEGREARAGRETTLRPLRLTAREVDDLVAFLESLTDEDVDPALLAPPPAR